MNASWHWCCCGGTGVYRVAKHYESVSDTTAATITAMTDAGVQVEWVGYITQTLTPELLSTCDILLIPSLPYNATTPIYTTYEKDSLKTWLEGGIERRVYIEGGNFTESGAVDFCLEQERILSHLGKNITYANGNTGNYYTDVFDPNHYLLDGVTVANIDQVEVRGASPSKVLWYRDSSGILDPILTLDSPIGTLRCWNGCVEDIGEFVTTGGGSSMWTVTGGSVVAWRRSLSPLASAKSYYVDHSTNTRIIALAQTFANICTKWYDFQSP